MLRKANLGATKQLSNGLGIKSDGHNFHSLFVCFNLLNENDLLDTLRLIEKGKAFKDEKSHVSRQRHLNVLIFLIYYDMQI